jgi:hypothetical protein
MGRDVYTIANILSLKKSYMKFHAFAPLPDVYCAGQINPSLAISFLARTVEMNEADVNRLTFERQSAKAIELI